MSGHKRTTISLSDLENARILELEDRLRTVEKDYEKIFRNIKKDHAYEMDHLFNQFQAEEQDFQNGLVQSIQENSHEIMRVMEDLQQGFNSSIQNQSKNIQQEMNNLETELFSTTSDLVVGYGVQVMQSLEEYISSRDTEIFQFHNNLLRTETQKQRAALDAYESANQLLDFIFNQYPIFRYYPDIQDSFISNLAQCRQNNEDGFFEAGLLSAQQIIQEIEKVRLFVKENEFRRKLLLLETRKAILELEALVRSNSQVNAIGIDQEDLGIKIDVQFWSNLEFQELDSEVQSLKESIEDEQNFFSEDELREIFDEVIPGIRKELENCVYWARRNVLASQIRFNIASSVIKALGSQGFLLTHGGYLDGDKRGIYQVHLQHIDGSEVVVEVKAVEEDICSTQLDLESLDAKIRSEHELRQRAYELARSLQGYGLNIGRNTKVESEIQNYPSDNNKPSFQNMILEQRANYGRH